MVIKNLSGYMLANNNHLLANGEQWWPCPADVWICRNLDVARSVLNASHKNTGLGTPIWTTIYRVRGTNIQCDRMDDEFIYTHAADKIFVDGAVHYQEPPRITERDLLKNARRIRASFTELMRANRNNSVKKER